ncbi:hypothetical protein DFR74_110207 [Nocardia puris]|uniref:Uncharacterized protein n=1 Tax=Nocardia puris TaxID=208602 RepID=A0A366DD24_9NOCA|nr:hypothetical protein DFR74_110207 [Nocardia puris]
MAADGRIVLKSGGLWRIDAHATLSGYTLNQMVVPIPTPPYFTVVTTYDPIAPKFWIEVVTSRGEFLTVRACDSLPNVATYAAGLAQVVANPFSTTFTHTFVLDEMPAEADPAAPDHWAYARLTMRYDPINTAHFADARCTVTGGTASSALVACRWSRDVHHRHYVPDVPDGGDLQ